jgi:hypothetical protein
MMAHGCVVAVADGLAPALRDTLFGLYLAKWAARPWHGTCTSQQGTSRHVTTKHDDLSMPCRIGSPCLDPGLGTTLNAPSHAMPCPTARRPSRVVPAQHRRVRPEAMLETSSCRHAGATAAATPPPLRALLCHHCCYHTTATMRSPVPPPLLWPATAATA